MKKTPKNIKWRYCTGKDAKAKRIQSDRELNQTVISRGGKAETYGDFLAANGKSRNHPLAHIHIS